MKRLPILAAIVAGAVMSSEGALASILPPNDLHLHPPAASGGITRGEFDAIIDELDFMFYPLVSYHGGTLVFLREWDNQQVNAFASRSGRDWRVRMLGGLARRPEITPEGFALVVCHELGHHLGGYPFYSPTDWAASEGEADYYATQFCLRALWLGDPANAGFRDRIPTTARRGCDAEWDDGESRGLCYRSAAAAQSLGNLFAALEGSSPPRFDRPDTSRVSSTIMSHPPAQCRLDTYYAGARCTMDFNYDIIPGLHAPLGRAGIYAEMEAAASSCFIASEWLDAEGYNHRDRPACWFKHQLAD